MRFVPPCPACMKSSTNTSFIANGLVAVRLLGGTSRYSSGFSGVRVTPPTLASRLAASLSSSPRGSGFGSRSRLSMGYAASSNRCTGSEYGSSSKLTVAWSQIVSDMVQNVGGDCAHPIVQDMGMAIRGSSPSYRGGTSASRGHSVARRNIR